MGNLNSLLDGPPAPIPKYVKHIVDHAIETNDLSFIEDLPYEQTRLARIYVDRRRAYRALHDGTLDGFEG